MRLRPCVAGCGGRAWHVPAAVSAVGHSCQALCLGPAGSGRIQGPWRWFAMAEAGGWYCETAAALVPSRCCPLAWCISIRRGPGPSASPFTNCVFLESAAGCSAAPAAQFQGACDANCDHARSVNPVDNRLPAVAVLPGRRNAC